MPPEAHVLNAFTPANAASFKGAESVNDKDWLEGGRLL